MIGHRTPEMTAILDAMHPGLEYAFGIESGSGAKAAVASVGASGLMQMALHGVGERVLCIVGGAFSKRWLDIARDLGKDVVALEVEWGARLDPIALSDALDRQGPFDAVTVVANETSTGTRTRIGVLTEVLQAFPDVLLLVDVVSYLGGGPVDFDENAIDFALAGIQKALACPPGAGVFAVSEEYIERAAAHSNRGWFLDPVRILKGHADRKPPNTPAIPLYRALAKQLNDIGAGVGLTGDDVGLTGAAAWTARFRRHQRMRHTTLNWALKHGLAPFPEGDLSSPTVSCIRAGSINVADFVAGLKQRGHTIVNGYGPLKGETFRIGHMGDHSEADLADLLRAADEVIG